MPHKEVHCPGLELKREECHVWHVSLEESDEDLFRLAAQLSNDEQKRAGSFLVAAPRTQFIVTRSALRLLLGGYLGVSAAAIAFRTNAHGKPELAQPNDDLRFNVSHSGRHALIALSRGADVGVDIEQHRPLDDWSGMAQMIWCDEDLARWQGLSAADRCRAFYLAWTRKEAVAKAVGLGMAADFKKLRVSFVPAAPAFLSGLDPAFGLAAEWSLIDIATPENYSAALAAKSPDVRVREYRVTLQHLHQGERFALIPHCRNHSALLK